MTVSAWVVLYGGGGFLAVAAVLALVRAIKGPTVLDRVIAADVLLTTVVLVLGLEMVVNQHANSIPVMIGVSATAALATITVARYVRRKETAKTEDAAADMTGMIDVQGNIPYSH